MKAKKINELLMKIPSLMYNFIFLHFRVLDFKKVKQKERDAAKQLYKSKVRF